MDSERVGVHPVSGQPIGLIWVFFGLQTEVKLKNSFGVIHTFFLKDSTNIYPHFTNKN